jgi:hypothetical protein
MSAILLVLALSAPLAETPVTITLVRWPYT